MLLAACAAAAMRCAALRCDVMRATVTSPRVPHRGQQDGTTTEQATPKQGPASKHKQASKAGKARGAEETHSHSHSPPPQALRCMQVAAWHRSRPFPTPLATQFSSNTHHPPTKLGCVVVKHMLGRGGWCMPAFCMPCMGGCDTIPYGAGCIFRRMCAYAGLGAPSRWDGWDGMGCGYRLVGWDGEVDGIVRGE